jgi:hypothetical protein
MGGITLITPTGGRPAAFALCDYQWLVVDDCEPETPCTMGQTVLRPKPSWSGQHTQARNLLLALPLVKNDIVLFVEDDDAYRVDYLSLMSRRFHSARTWLVGERDTHYYHVTRRAHRHFHNQSHSSLCGTGIRTDHLHTITEVCHSGIACLDMPLWHRYGRSGTLFPHSGACIGIKGMPGRPGVTATHREPRGWVPDPDLSVLRSWLGDDANLYTTFLGGN